MLIASPRHTARDLEAWRRVERSDPLVARMKTHRARIRAAVATLRDFARAAPCYAGVSWGKDSVVLAHLVVAVAAECGPRIPLVWVRVEPVANPDCAAVRDAFLAAHPGLDYREVEVWCSRDADGWHASGTLESGFARAAELTGATRYASGIRAAESGGRKRRMTAWGETSPNTCAPIGWWTGADVFAYLHAHRLPVHPAYAMSMGGVLDRDRIRVASIGGQRGTGTGRAEWEARYYRDALARIDVSPGRP